LEGIEQLYYLNEFLFGNCTSAFSFPPPNLAWYINSEKADSSFLQPFHEEIIDAYGFKMYQRSLEIRFRIDERTIPYINEKVTIRCVSQMKGLPSETRESAQIFTVATEPELKNQKLIKWNNSGEREEKYENEICHGN
jgi:hypothetical protein